LTAASGTDRIGGGGKVPASLLGRRAVAGSPAGRAGLFVRRGNDAGSKAQEDGVGVGGAPRIGPTAVRPPCPSRARTRNSSGRNGGETALRSADGKCGLQHKFLQFLEASDEEGAMLSCLLDEFHQLPRRIDPLPTLLEIAGCPHYENVCSNILAFFFDSRKPHGLGTLFVDALAQVLGIDNREGAIGGEIVVEREVTTRNGNRLDILIQTDNWIFLIENKIFSAAGNPFGDYAGYIKDLWPKNRATEKILLTPARTTDGAEDGFKNVLHRELVGKVRALLGQYATAADTRYLIFVLDFLNTLDNLQRSTAMDEAFVKLLADRCENVEDLLRQISTFKDEIRSKITELASVTRFQGRPNVRQWPWRDRGRLLDVLVHEIKLSSGLLVRIDTIIRPKGWEIQIYLPSRSGNRSELCALLQRLEISCEEPSGKEERFTLPTRFEYSEKLDSIQSALQQLIVRLADF
jgi:hypothetical protein